MMKDNDAEVVTDKQASFQYYPIDYSPRPTGSRLS